MSTPHHASHAPEATGVTIPMAMRVGGAFMTVALVLALLVLVSIFSDGFGAMFEWTWGTVAIIVAALLVGAFATQRRDQQESRQQVAALVVALILVIASRFLPTEPLTSMGQYVVALYALAAFLCAIIIRRTQART